MNSKPHVEKQYIDNIPALALRGMTVFPGALFHFDAGRKKSLKALEQAMSAGQKIFLVTQKEISTDDPSYDDLYIIGCLCNIRQIVKVPGDNVRVLVEGIQRAKLLCLAEEEPCLRANIELLTSHEIENPTKRDLAMLRQSQELFLEYSVILPQTANDVVMHVIGCEDPNEIADYIAQNVQMKYQKKQEILEELDSRRRLRLFLKYMTEELELLQLEQSIQEQVKEQMDRGQREYYLREQMKAISDELGEGEDAMSEAQEYLAKIQKKQLPAEVAEKLSKEARRLVKMQSTAPESGVVRTYLDVCLELPWTEVSKENDDIHKAKAILDADHYGMEKVKERILEFFAVKQLTGGVKGQILCLAGPPGVGKTSVARSIAKAMGRNYARLSLGGVRDEAEIRGQRKTYIGAMPGRIINALKQAKTRNCLILIDEIDKLGSDYKGDPSSALLEVFDTEQNVAFRDHFVELPFDLSDVLFVTTANDLGSIPGPLLDRMEVIELGSYTDEEKLQIAKLYILPKQLKKHGLKGNNLRITDDGIRQLISCYTRESGVRELEREIAKLCRKTAKVMSEEGKKQLRFTKDNLQQYLGTPKFKKDVLEAMPECGLVNGLAWTSVGGELLQVEALALDGTGKLELTGNLGDVMKESARAAISYLRSRADQFGLPKDFYQKKDIHIHFPEGAVPKDGPSAGITTATAIISALTGRPVSKQIAMTGEITLRGRVLPIGGLREKTMAAYKNGVKTVIIPQENKPDLENIDQTVRNHLSFVCASHMDEVVTAVFGTAFLQQTEEAQTSLMTPLPASNPSRSIRTRSSR